MVINRIGVVKLGVFQGCMGAFFGLLIGICMTLFGSLISGIAPDGGAGAAAIVGGMGIFMVVLLPIMYGVFGFIAGVIGAAAYNLIAKFVGGIEFDVT
jgi:hypothetical protein